MGVTEEQANCLVGSVDRAVHWDSFRNGILPFCFGTTLFRLALVFMHNGTILSLIQSSILRNKWKPKNIPQTQGLSDPGI